MKTLDIKGYIPYYKIVNVHEINDIVKNIVPNLRFSDYGSWLLLDSRTTIKAANIYKINYMLDPPKEYYMPVWIASLLYNVFI